MPPTRPLVLIVDGNNLAHYLYQFSTHKPVSAGDIQLMSMQLSQYVRAARQPVVIELCLDHFPAGQPLPRMGGVEVFVASVQEEADDVLRERFRFHDHQNHPCLVVTNDTKVREDVEEEGGAALLVYDFVRRQGKKPVFRDPSEFPSRNPLPRLAEGEPSPQPAETVVKRPTPRPLRAPAPSPVETPLPEPPAQPVIESPPASEKPLDAVEAQPAYRLTLESWPLEKGVRFLVDSFCPEHGAEYRELYRSLKDHPLFQHDLYELANALVKYCGEEPEFATRGSLIDRLRLALLLSPEQDVPLEIILKRTGLPARGLQGRIKEKARGWLKIV